MECSVFAAQRSAHKTLKSCVACEHVLNTWPERRKRKTKTCASFCMRLWQPPPAREESPPKPNVGSHRNSDSLAHTQSRPFLPPKKKNPTILVYLLFHISPKLHEKTAERRRRRKKGERGLAISKSASAAKKRNDEPKTTSSRDENRFLTRNAAPVNSFADSHS